MIQYSIKRKNDSVFIFAKECEIISQIEVDTACIDPDRFIKLLREQQVAPEHLRDVYEDLLFSQNML